MSKTKLILFIIAGVVIVTLSLLTVKSKQAEVFKANFTFTTSTQATSTVNITNWTPVYTAGNGSQGYVSLCDNADGGISTGNPLYLAFGATSTKPYGFRLASGSCYTMSQATDNMFYGTIYAIASTATTTLLTVYK